MTAPTRVLLLATSLGRGGAERQVVDLATKLRARGWVVAVVSMLAPTDHVPELEAAGVHVHSLDMRRGRATLASLLAYVRVVRRWRPDVVHSHMVHANLLARLGRLLVPRVPVISTVHNVVEGREGTGGMAGSRYRELAYRITDRLASATTAVSDAATARYIRVRASPQGRIVTIPNGIHLGTQPLRGSQPRLRRELADAASFVWVTAGRLVPEKGHDLLLDAWASIHAAHPAAALLIAGDGPCRPDLEARVADPLFKGSVRLLGLRRDLPAVLAAADAFVLPSYVEGLPMVLLEAAGAGLPIVCTDVGGNREAASPEAGALVVECTTTSLTAAMLEIMVMPPERLAAIGESLRDHVASRFDLDIIVDRWEALYRSRLRS